MEFWTIIRDLHNIVRWLVVLAGIWALVAAVMGLASGRRFRAPDRTPGLVFVSSLDLQLLLGVVLYVVSPLVRGAMQMGMGEAMRTTELRFYLVEHALMMVLAVAAGHIGYSLSKRESRADRARFTGAAILYAVALALIFFATPWGRPLLPWGLA